MIGLIAMEFVTAMVSLEVFFAFRNESGTAAAIGWNFIFAVEMVGMMSISERVAFLGFLPTYRYCRETGPTNTHHTWRRHYQSDRVNYQS